MNTKEDISYVEDISDSEICIVCRDDSSSEKVKSLGGKRRLSSPMNWTLQYTSETELASHLSELRDAQFAMAGSLSGWPPSAIFEQLRDKRVLAGKFSEIMWAGPGKEVLFEK